MAKNRARVSACAIAPEFRRIQKKRHFVVGVSSRFVCHPGSRFVAQVTKGTKPGEEDEIITWPARGGYDRLKMLS